jgi:mono/diheme cytochrome c family protein
MSVILVCACAIVIAWAEPPAAGAFKSKCAACHGASGDGNTPAGKALNVPPLTSEAVLNETDANLLVIVKNGKGKMPAWHDALSDEEIKNLIAYIRTMRKK